MLRNIIVFCTVLLSPGVVAASHIELQVGPGTFSFGLGTAFVASAEAGVACVNDGCPQFPDGSLKLDPMGWLEMSSGPLEGLITNSGWSEYQYGPANLTFTASWTLPDGTAETGGLTAHFDQFSLSFLENGFGDEYGLTFIDSGLIDPALAGYLGVSRRITWGWMDLYGGYDGDATSASRTVPMSSETWISIHTVPEPSLSALALLAMLAMRVRSSRRPT